jgi:hypothetical protein
VNKEMYTDILHRLTDVVTRKRPKMENQQFVSPSQHCSSTPVGFGKGVRTKRCANIEISHTHSPNVAPADFHLLPRLKSALKGRSFCGTTDTTQNATEELKRLSQYGFQE